MIEPTIIEHIRELSIESCFELSAFQTGWSSWKSSINQILGLTYNENDILNISDHLSDIFLSTRGSGRTQASLSGAGYGWEGLICWYLNLCFAGTRGVAIRKNSLLPEPLRNSISVNYGNFKSNTESDIIVVVFPDHEEFKINKDHLTINDKTGKQIPVLNGNKFNYRKLIDRMTEIHFDSFNIGIIQCKTNWNDNAQIPMLWSMIYETESFSNNAISIGMNGYSINDMTNFSYSFVTVPTNGLSNYKQNSTSVNRVRNLTGGNYWGYPSKSSIASSLKEIFNNNFRDAFSNNVRQSLKRIIPDLRSDLNYFNLI